MRLAGALSIIIFAGLLRAQNGQEGSRPGWPCVAGRPVDPTYIDTSESTGGLLFLFQKNEVAQASLVMSASHTHPSTLLRALGNLNGSRDFEFPVDSSIESLLVLVSLQCRNAISVFRPTGSEVTKTSGALSVDLQAGRILRIDQAETGQWRVRLEGTGLFVVSILARADIGLTRVAFPPNSDPLKEKEYLRRLNTPLFGVRQNVEIQLSGHVSGLRLQLVDAAGDRISDMEALEPIAEGAYRTTITPQVERFRILVTGTDASARPFQRMYPVLYRAQPK